MKRFISIATIITFIVSSILLPQRSYAQDQFSLPEPGVMLNLSHAYVPVLIKGLRVHPENPLLFDFILNTGKSGLKISSPEFKAESEKLIKYFLASLTIKEDDLWVNLSPYEKDRMIPQELGQTELGRDMLAEDYILKQLTASLIYPEKQLGKEFWQRVYAKAQEMYGSTEIPVNTFNKVWIVADKAKVLERNNTAYVVGAHLKVMLEEDYLSLQDHSAVLPLATRQDTHSIGANIIRQIILPELEKEVNQGQHFANLRQMFYSMILATWYKETLKTALLNQVYSNRSKVGNLSFKDLSSPNVSIGDPQYIYQQYLKAYKKGVFNYIKEDIDTVSKQKIPRKYFSGGLAPNLGIRLDRAIKATSQEIESMDEPGSDFAMESVNMDRAQGADASDQPVFDTPEKVKDNLRRKPVVLIVDDNFTKRQSIILGINSKNKGIKLLIAIDGLEGLKMVREHADEIGLIVSDYNMPGLDGSEFRRELLAVDKFKKIPFILHTTLPPHPWQGGINSFLVRMGVDVVNNFIPDAAMPATLVSDNAMTTEEIIKQIPQGIFDYKKYVPMLRSGLVPPKVKFVVSEGEKSFEFHVTWRKDEDEPNTYFLNVAPEDDNNPVYRIYYYTKENSDELVYANDAADFSVVPIRGIFKAFTSLSLKDVPIIVPSEVMNRETKAIAKSFLSASQPNVTFLSHSQWGVTLLGRSRPDDFLLILLKDKVMIDEKNSMVSWVNINFSLFGIYAEQLKDIFHHAKEVELAYYSKPQDINLTIDRQQLLRKKYPNKQAIQELMRKFIDLQKQVLGKGLKFEDVLLKALDYQAKRLDVISQQAPESAMNSQEKLKELWSLYQKIKDPMLAIRTAAYATGAPVELARDFSHIFIDALQGFILRRDMLVMGNKDPKFIVAMRGNLSGISAFLEEWGAVDDNSQEIEKLKGKAKEFVDRYESDDFKKKLQETSQQHRDALKRDYYFDQFIIGYYSSDVLKAIKNARLIFNENYPMMDGILRSLAQEVAPKDASMIAAVPVLLPEIFADHDALLSNYIKLAKSRKTDRNKKLLVVRRQKMLKLLAYSDLFIEQLTGKDYRENYQAIRMQELIDGMRKYPVLQGVVKNYLMLIDELNESSSGWRKVLDPEKASEDYYQDSEPLRQAMLSNLELLRHSLAFSILPDIYKGMLKPLPSNATEGIPVRKAASGIYLTLALRGKDIIKLSDIDVAPSDNNIRRRVVALLEETGLIVPIKKREEWVLNREGQSSVQALLRLDGKTEALPFIQEEITRIRHIQSLIDPLPAQYRDDFNVSKIDHLQNMLDVFNDPQKYFPRLNKRVWKDDLVKIFSPFMIMLDSLEYKRFFEEFIVDQGLGQNDVSPVLGAIKDPEILKEILRLRAVEFEKLPEKKIDLEAFKSFVAQIDLSKEKVNDFLNLLIACNFIDYLAADSPEGLNRLYNFAKAYELYKKDVAMDSQEMRRQEKMEIIAEITRSMAAVLKSSVFVGKWEPRAITMKGQNIYSVALFNDPIFFDFVRKGDKIRARVMENTNFVVKSIALRKIIKDLNFSYPVNFYSNGQRGYCVVRSDEGAYIVYDVAMRSEKPWHQGGIDLNAKHMRLDVSREGNSVEMKFDPALIAKFQHEDFNGIVPHIIRISPLTSPLPLLGIGPSLEKT